MSASVAFAVLRTPVRVTSPVTDALERVRVCYGTCIDAVVGTEPIEASIDRYGHRFLVRVAGREDALADDLLGAISALNHELLHALMLRNLHLFYLHAGVVAFGEHAIVLPGLSRAGKSTIVLALLRAGARLLSDELAIFDPATGRLLAFPRAIKVRDACVHYFPEWESGFVGTGEGRFLRFDALDADAVTDSARARLIAAPRWDAACETELLPLTHGQGLLHLASAALNFGSQGTRSIDHLAAIAAGAESFALHWSCPHEAARSLRARLEALTVSSR